MKNIIIKAIINDFKEKSTQHKRRQWYLKINISTFNMGLLLSIVSSTWDPHLFRGTLNTSLQRHLYTMRGSHSTTFMPSLVKYLLPHAPLWSALMLGECTMINVSISAFFKLFICHFYSLHMGHLAMNERLLTWAWCPGVKINLLETAWSAVSNNCI